MALLLSTGFKAGILGPSSFEALMNGGAIALFGGSQPATPDAAATGAFFGYVTAAAGAWSPSSPSAGLNWVRAGAFASKDPGQEWAINPILDGVPTWFRILSPFDDPTQYSITAPRIDGAVGNIASLAELKLFNPVLSIGEVIVIDNFFYTIPPIETE